MEEPTLRVSARMCAHMCVRGHRAIPRDGVCAFALSKELGFQEALRVLERILVERFRGNVFKVAATAGCDATVSYRSPEQDGVGIFHWMHRLSLIALVSAQCQKHVGGGHGIEF